MSKLFDGFFKRIERTENSQPPSLQSLDEEYIAYCIEQEQTIRKLEEGLHASDDPKEIAMQTLRTTCSFYDSDWAGIIELDLELNIATSGWWYSPNPSVMKSVKAYEYESISHMHTWLHSIKNGAPVIIHDATDTKITSPQEYHVYKRFDVKSIVAVPFGPNPVGFLVVRNPKRYINRTSTLNALAYVIHRAMAQRNYIESAKMSISSDGIKDDKDIVINFFGAMSIETQSGVWREHDFNSPKCSRVIAYILLQGKKAHSALSIADALYPEDTMDADSINKNIRSYIYRFRKSFDLISSYNLIEYTSTGYRPNPILRIKTDLKQFEDIWECVQNSIPILEKVYLLKRAIKLYKGAVFESACDEHWLVGIATEYKMKYIGMVNSLLSILAEFDDYNGINHYALKSLKLVPENVRAQYWLIYSMYHSGAITLAKQELQQAKQRLTEEEYTTLKKFIIEDKSMQNSLLFDD